MRTFSVIRPGQSGTVHLRRKKSEKVPLLSISQSIKGNYRGVYAGIDGLIPLACVGHYRFEAAKYRMLAPRQVAPAEEASIGGDPAATIPGLAERKNPPRACAGGAATRQANATCPTSDTATQKSGKRKQQNYVPGAVLKALEFICPGAFARHKHQNQGAHEGLLTPAARL